MWIWDENKVVTNKGILNLSLGSIKLEQMLISSIYHGEKKENIIIPTIQDAYLLGGGWDDWNTRSEN